MAFPQYISLPKKIDDFESEQLKLKFVVSGKDKLTLGSHKENRFKIIVSNIIKKDFKRFDFFANYFDTSTNM